MATAVLISFGETDSHGSGPNGLATEQGSLMTAPKNERVTENVVRDELRELGYFKPKTKIIVEEQKSQIETVKRLMKAASKSGQGGGDRQNSSFRAKQIQTLSSSLNARPIQTTT